MLTQSADDLSSRPYIDAAEILQSPACVLSADGTVVYLNSAWEKLHPSPVESQSLFQLVHAKHLQPVQEFWQRLGGEASPATIECRLSPDNRWFQLSLHPVKHHAHIAWLCVAADVNHLVLEHRAMERKSQLQSKLLDVTADCIKLISPAGQLLYVNSAGRIALGLSEEAGLDQQWLSLLPEIAWAPGREALHAAGQGRPAGFTGYSQLPGQKGQVWDNALTPVKDAAGQVDAIICISRDISAAQESRDALLQSQQRVEMASAIGGLGIWELDIRNDVLFCDETWHRIVGRDLSNPVHGMAEFRQIIHPDDVERATEVQQTAKDLIAQQSDYSITFRIVRPSGEIRWVRSVACLTTDTSGEPVKATGCIIDITDTLRGEMALRDANRLLERERDTLAQRCMEDPLTRIANRRFLDSELSHICMQTNFSGDVIAVGMLDVDYFKAYNDHYGHPRGDEVLCQIAAALKTSARHSDFVARYGGEEFAFIMRAQGTPRNALKRIFAAIEGLAIAHEKSPYGRITISCGCVLVQGGHLDPHTLIQDADQVLYEAKTKGRNRFVIRSQRERVPGVAAMVRSAESADWAH